MFGEVHDKLGRLDGLVNNAARFTMIDPLEITEADWDFIHDVNLKATFFCCQAAGRIMKAQEGGGRIVNISSLGGLRPWSMHAHYCASKAGVIMLTKALSKAFAPTVTVNSVAPGVILPPRNGGAGGPHGGRYARAARRYARRSRRSGVVFPERERISLRGKRWRWTAD